jgi:hypothetical protein
MVIKNNYNDEANGSRKGKSNSIISGHSSPSKVYDQFKTDYSIVGGSDGFNIAKNLFDPTTNDQTRFSSRLQLFRQ